MENILYLDDYINLYNKRIDKLICVKPYKKTLNYGKIWDKIKFIKSFNKIKDKYKLNNNIFSEEIVIIINSTYSKEDKKILKDVMEELNYKNIKFINELEIIKIDKKLIFINYNYSYLNLYYLDEFGNTLIKSYENDYIIKKVIKNILEVVNKEKIIISGKNYMELINILNGYNYYYYEENNNLFINLLINKNV